MIISNNLFYLKNNYSYKTITNFIEMNISNNFFLFIHN